MIQAPTCRKCNDTGTWPMLPVTFCSCEAGVAAQAEAERRAERDRLIRVWTSCQVPARFGNLTLEGHPDKHAVAAAIAWAKSNRSTNVLITGPVGEGKTGLAAAMVRYLVKNGITGIRFVSVPAMLDAFRPGADADPSLMGDLLSTHILVLDDLGAERATDWVRERLYVLINGRYEAMRATIVTTNFDNNTLAAALGERTISRLTEDVSEIVVTGGRR